jgi:hypothetical protein
MRLAALLLFSALLGAQTVNLSTAKWVHQKDGADSVLIREDITATEYMVRYPAGHVFRCTFYVHWDGKLDFNPE